MVKKRRLSKKQKKEIALVVGAVLLVAVVGLITTSLATERVSAIAGAAIRLNPEVPTYSGIIILLKDYGGLITGDGTCDSICGEKMCIPVEEDCNKNLVDNKCFCNEIIE